MDTLVECFRPTGQKELDLVAASGYTQWPPRLPDQDIFYPVTNEAMRLHSLNGISPILVLVMSRAFG